MFSRTSILPLIVFSGFLLFTGCTRDFGSLAEKAQAAFDQEKYTEVIDLAQLALPRWDESDGAESRGHLLQLVGLSYQKLRNIDKAMIYFERAVGAANNTFTSAYKLGSLHLSANQPEIAEKYFKKALRMKKNDPLTLLGLGNVYYEQKRYILAKTFYKRVLEASPGVKEAMHFIRLSDKKLAAKNKKKRTTKKRKKRR